MYVRDGLKVTSVVCVYALLSGCMGAGANTSETAGEVSRLAAPAVVLDARLENGQTSDIIQNLLNRHSILEAGAFSNIAEAVLAANARASEADLRAAKLRAQARAKNWLPSLGPSVSLTSLGAVVTAMVVEQVIFDNGRKKAERDYAAADIEVAAVTLAQDTNARVLAGLELYLSAQKATARANINAAAMAQMTRYEFVMAERVKGGVSSRVDLQIVQQKMNQMQSDMASDQETAAGAMSELGAMTAAPITDVKGLSGFYQTNVDQTPLAVMKAQAESTRMIAEATAARAGVLPSLTAGGTLGQGGGVGLSLGAENALGFGTAASLEAIEAQKAAAAARVGQAQEDANRALRALEGELASLMRQEVQAQTLAAQAAANYDIYAAQQQAGQRAVPDVVGIFETKLRTEREAVGLKYEIARVTLKIAALNGTLVNGENI